jgi:asparagine synthetase A
VVGESLRADDFMALHHFVGNIVFHAGYKKLNALFRVSSLGIRMSNSSIEYRASCTELTPREESSTYGIILVGQY